MQAQYAGTYTAGILIPMKKTLEQLALMYNLQINVVESGWLVKDGVFRVSGDSNSIDMFTLHMKEWTARITKD